MKNKLISLLIVFLLGFGLLGISFGMGGVNIPTMPEQPVNHSGGGTPSPGGNMSGGGTPSGSENQSGGNTSSNGNQSTGDQIITINVQPGFIFVSQNSQDLVIVKMKSNSVTVSNTTTTGVNSNIAPKNNTTEENKSYPIRPWRVNSTVRVRAPAAPFTHLNGNAITIITPGDVEDNGRIGGVSGGVRQTGPWRGSNCDTISGWVPESGDGIRTICLTQTTPAGTIPHVLQSSNGDTYYAFCMEPEQKASVGENLIMAGEAPAIIEYMIEDTNPEDLNDSYRTQLKIWEIVTAGKVNPNTGEMVAMKKALGISDERFKQDINLTQQEIQQEFNVEPDQMSGLLEFKTVNIFGYNLLGNIIIGFKHLFGIYYPYKPLISSFTSSESQQGTYDTGNGYNSNGNSSSSSISSKKQKSLSPGMVTCPKCSGSGLITQQDVVSKWVICTNCGGSGQKYDSIEGGWHTCSVCHGTGGHSVLTTKYTQVTCPTCGGTGEVNA